MSGAAGYVEAGHPGYTEGYPKYMRAIRAEQIEAFKNGLSVGNILTIVRKKPIYDENQKIVTYQYSSRYYAVTAKYPHVVQLETQRGGRVHKVTMDYNKLYILTREVTEEENG